MTHARPEVSIESGLRVAVIVSQDPSDLYFANRLARHVNVVAIVVENQLTQPDTTPRYLKALRLASRPREFFGRLSEFAASAYWQRVGAYVLPAAVADFGEWGQRLYVPKSIRITKTEGVRRINDSQYARWLAESAPDIIAVCGASILGPGILEIPRLGALNLHGGLSQFYRGLFTTDWAIHNHQPECIGATVHFVSSGIDDGEVVSQGRPQIVADDNPYTAYEKVVKLGVQMMIRAIRNLEAEKGRSEPLSKLGRLYFARDFTRRAKHRTWRAVERGVIVEYVRDKEFRDVPVVRDLINDLSELAHSSGTQGARGARRI